MPDNARLILNFHGVGKPDRQLDAGEADVWITESALVAFADVVATRSQCDITFDDGNKSDVEIALPILLERGLRATFFLLTGRIGTPGFLDEDDIKHLHASGMDIGLHGQDHVSWRVLDRPAMDVEIDQAKRRLETVIADTVSEAACPFGDYGRRTLSYLRQADFQAVYTSDGGIADTGSWLRPRRSVRSAETPEIIAHILSEPFGKRFVRSAKTALKSIR